jgi:hypothetical protein
MEPAVGCPHKPQASAWCSSKMVRLVSSWLGACSYKNCSWICKIIWMSEMTQQLVDNTYDACIIPLYFVWLQQPP